MQNRYQGEAQLRFALDVDQLFSEPIIPTLASLALLGCLDSFTALRKLRLLNRNMHLSISVVFTPHLIQLNRKFMLGEHSASQIVIDHLCLPRTAPVCFREAVPPPPTQVLLTACALNDFVYASHRVPLVLTSLGHRLRRQGI